MPRPGRPIVIDPKDPAHDGQAADVVAILQRIADGMPAEPAPRECRRCRTRQPQRVPCAQCAATAAALEETPRPLKRGEWLPDDGIVDEVAIERACAHVTGRPLVALSVAERDEVIRRMAANGRTDRDIGSAIGMSDRHVLRNRQRLGVAPGFHVAS